VAEPEAAEAAPKPAAPEPAAPEPAAPEPAAPEPVLELAEAEAGPVIKPIVVGVDTPAGAKRRGWWKR